MFAVSQNNAAYIAHAKTVYQYLPCRNGAGHLQRFAVQFHYFADLADMDIRFRNTHRNRQISVFAQMLVLTEMCIRDSLWTVFCSNASLLVSFRRERLFLINFRL